MMLSGELNGHSSWNQLEMPATVNTFQNSHLLNLQLQNSLSAEAF